MTALPDDWEIIPFTPFVALHYGEPIRDVNRQPMVFHSKEAAELWCAELDRDWALRFPPRVPTPPSTPA